MTGAQAMQFRAQEVQTQHRNATNAGGGSAFSLNNGRNAPNFTTKLARFLQNLHNDRGRRQC